MPFPLTRHRRLRLPAERSVRLDGLTLALHRAGALDLAIRDASISFRVPWGVTAGPLWGITRGELILHDGTAGGDLRYSLSLGRGCLTIAAAVLLWVAFEVGWMETAPGVAALRGMVVWLCLWGAGYVWVAWRFPRFVRQALSETQPSSGP